jgi:hypothetical protein
MTVRSLLSNRKKWTKGKMMRGCGHSKSYCLLGALMHCYLKENEPATRYLKAKRRLEKAIAEFLGFSGIQTISFNDSRSRTHEDILKVVRKARV